jgi:hypothetical protein
MGESAKWHLKLGKRHNEMSGIRQNEGGNGRRR